MTGSLEIKKKIFEPQKKKTSEIGNNRMENDQYIFNVELLKIHKSILLCIN